MPRPDRPGNEEKDTCPKCKGSGTVIKDGEMITCPRCNGTGKDK
jgi:DnaJ-class molecular chaperone